MLHAHYTNSRSRDDERSGAVGEDRLARSAPARLFTYGRFGLADDDEPLSQPSTAQSSRSQTPDNTDMDNSDADNSDQCNTDADNSDVDDSAEHVAKLLGGRAARSAAPKPARRRTHINDLPLDVIPAILFYLDTHDLLALMLVQRRWYSLVVPCVWSKPKTATMSTLEGFVSVITASAPELTLPYAHYVARLNLSTVGRSVQDKHVLKLARCTNLKRLVLSRCDKISPRAVQRVLRDAPGLWMLELDEVPIDDRFLEHTARVCENLQVLYISSDTITDAGLAELARIGPGLRRLRLKGCKHVTLRGVRTLAVACPNLVELDISDMACFSAISQLYDSSAGFTDEEMQSILMSCTSLRILRIGPSPRLTKDAFNRRKLRMLRLANLRELVLSGCPAISDAGVLRLTEAAPRLRHLNLSRCHQITDRSLEYIACAFGPFIDYLHVGHCLNITDKGVIIIAQYCPKLTFFDAANCSNLTDHSIVQLAKLPRLKRIGIVKCMGITDRSVEAIAEHLKGVERLHLSYCAAITPYSIRTLLLECQDLIHLSLTGVPAFMTEDIRRMAREPPSDLSEHQRQVFCVFGQPGVCELRRYLFNTYVPVKEIEESVEADERRLAHNIRIHEEPLFDELDGEDEFQPRERGDHAVSEGLRQASALFGADRPTAWNTLYARDGPVRFGPRNATRIESLARQLEALSATPVPNEFLGQLLGNPNARDQQRWDNAGIGAANLWNALGRNFGTPDPEPEDGDGEEDESWSDATVAPPPPPPPPPPALPQEVPRTNAIPLSQLRMHRFRLSVRGEDPISGPPSSGPAAPSSSPPTGPRTGPPTGPLEGPELRPE